MLSIHLFPWRSWTFERRKKNFQKWTNEKERKKTDKKRTMSNINMNCHQYTGFVWNEVEKNEFRCERGESVLFEHYHWDEGGACNVIARQNALQIHNNGGKIITKFSICKSFEFFLLATIACAMCTAHRVPIHQGPVCNKFFRWLFFLSLLVLNLIASLCLGVFVHKLIYPSIDMWTYAFNRSGFFRIEWAESMMKTTLELEWKFTQTIQSTFKHIAYAKWNVSDIPVDPRIKKDIDSFDVVRFNTHWHSCCFVRTRCYCHSARESIRWRSINKQ